MRMVIGSVMNWFPVGGCQLGGAGLMTEKAR
jgi:hypothetical protein